MGAHWDPKCSGQCTRNSERYAVLRRGPNSKPFNIARAIQSRNDRHLLLTKPALICAATLASTTVLGTLPALPTARTLMEGLFRLRHRAAMNVSLSPPDRSF